MVSVIYYDDVGAKYFKKANSVCFIESSPFVVEVLVKEHKKLEVIEVKKKEAQNLGVIWNFWRVVEGQKALGSLSKY